MLTTDYYDKQTIEMLRANVRAYLQEPDGDERLDLLYFRTMAIMPHHGVVRPSHLVELMSTDNPEPGVYVVVLDECDDEEAHQQEPQNDQ